MIEPEKIGCYSKGRYRKTDYYIWYANEFTLWQGSLEGKDKPTELSYKSKAAAEKAIRAWIRLDQMGMYANDAIFNSLY